MDENTKEKLARIGALYVALYELKGRLESEVSSLTPDELIRALASAPLAKSALDVFANMGEHPRANRGYVDADEAYTFGPSSLDDKGLFTSIEGPYPGIDHELTFIELGQNGITSGHISSVACDVALENGQGVERIFVRYKGGDLYRYWPFRDGHSRWGDIVTICARMKQALMVELTVGEYVERVLKMAHEQGKVTCERLDGDVWVTALKPSEVIAKRAEGKARRKGQEVAVEVVREMAADLRNPDEAQTPHPESPVAVAPLPASPTGTEDEDVPVGEGEVPSL